MIDKLAYYGQKVLDSPKNIYDSVMIFLKYKQYQTKDLSLNDIARGILGSPKNIWRGMIGFIKHQEKELRLDSLFEKYLRNKNLSEKVDEQILLRNRKSSEFYDLIEENLKN